MARWSRTCSPDETQVSAIGAETWPAETTAIICNDRKSRAVLDLVNRVALSDAPLLIVGETGTGKELIARHLHAQSGRKGPFVAVDCNALADSTAATQLFGSHANGGTLFLDGISQLRPSSQVKLLRVLQEREVASAGSRRPTATDVRLVSSTDVDMSDAIATGRFRLDLYYRLNVVTLHLPPLRERPADIPPLAEYFVDVYSRQRNRIRPRLMPETADALQRHSWPGNVRELQNVIHAAVLLAADGEIRVRDLTVTAAAGSQADPLVVISSELQRLFCDPLPNLHQRLEELTVRHAFAFCNNNQVHTARLLGLSRNPLRRLLKRFGLLGSETAALHDRHAVDLAMD